MFEACEVCGAPRASSLHSPNHPVNALNPKVHEFVAPPVGSANTDAPLELNSVNPQFDAIITGTVPC